MKKTDPEYMLHVEVAKWLEHNGFIWFHPPNEGVRSPWYAKMLQAIGMKKGVPDIIICGRGCVLLPLAIELKGPGKKPTPAQRDFLACAGACGWGVAAFDDYDKVIAFIEKAYMRAAGTPLRGGAPPRPAPPKARGMPGLAQ